VNYEREERRISAKTVIQMIARVQDQGKHGYNGRFGRRYEVMEAEYVESNLSVNNHRLFRTNEWMRQDGRNSDGSVHREWGDY